MDLFIWYKNFGSRLFRFVTMHAFYKRWNRQTDRKGYCYNLYCALHSKSHGINYSSITMRSGEILQVYNKPGWCQLFSYATYVTSFLSVWFVVSFSFERYLTIQFPLKRHVLCRPRRAWMVVLSITGLALLLYNFALWTSVVEPIDASRGRHVHVCKVRLSVTFASALPVFCSLQKTLSLTASNFVVPEKWRRHFGRVNHFSHLLIHRHIRNALNMDVVTYFA